MKIELRVISGARAGHRDVFERNYIAIGRHPMSDLRFDAEKDLDASTRHAAIVKTGDDFLLRDLGSTNGTFLNGVRIGADQRLSDGDTMRFGLHGPEVVFTVLREEAEVVIPAVQAPRPAPDAATKAPPAAPGPAGPARPAPPKPARTAPEAKASTAAAQRQQRPSVLLAVISETRSRLRAVAAMLTIIVVGALVVVVWQARRSAESVSAVQLQVDSLAQELAQLRTLKAQADSERSRLEELLRAERDPRRRSQIEAQLTDAARRSDALEQAQSVDYTAIRNGNHRAVAIIYVRFSDTTQMWTGTAFSVSGDGVMLTNRHIVINSSGEGPRDIAIQFSGSTDVHPARLVRIAPDADLAVIQLESAGPFPAVRGLDASGAQTGSGAPVALIGFPGGGGDTERGATATLVTGSITRAVGDSLLEVDAFSGTGASGSPIIGRDGRVVGVLFGGRGGASSREIVGLPIGRALQLLDR